MFDFSWRVTVHYHNLDKIILPITEAQDVYTFIEKKKKKAHSVVVGIKQLILEILFICFYFFYFLNCLGRNIKNRSPSMGMMALLLYSKLW